MKDNDEKMLEQDQSGIEELINREEFERLKKEVEMYKSLDTLSKLIKLQDETFVLMYKRVITGEATSADFNAIINTLKHNEITVDKETEDELKSLTEKLEKKRARSKPTAEDIAELKNVIHFNVNK